MILGEYCVYQLYSFKNACLLQCWNQHVEMMFKWTYFNVLSACTSLHMRHDDCFCLVPTRSTLSAEKTPPLGVPKGI